MRRRGLTVVLGAALAVLLLIGIGQVRVPYVVESAGPTVDTLTAVDDSGEVCTPGAPGAPQSCHEVISVTGGPDVSKSAGQLRLVTVNVQSSTDLVSVIRGWWSDEQAVVPYELLYPPDATREEIDQQGQEDFKNSQSSAETAALRELGYPVRITVEKVVAGGPSEGRLKPGDVIDTVDGVPVTSNGKLLELIQGKPAGTALKLGVTRDKAGTTVEVTTGPASATDDTPRVGVEVRTEQPHPFTLNIKLDDIAGPSAGLMFALGIIDKLQPEDLTGGKVIAGTGTIDDEGEVGPIGGIPQKMYGARAAGATIFLTPAANCKEARANALPGLPLAKVGTLDEALAALATVRAGGQPPSC
jgi:PDZ domain-containing protein